MKTVELEEIQGLYGPITVPETLLQKIWMRRDFNIEKLTTTDGKPLKIIRVGQWNLQEGPDFLNAEIEVADSRLVGDIEIHFHSRDWNNHGHNTNLQFNNVVLHVVLFEPSPAEVPALTAAGRTLHTIILLPLLIQDIETYATEDALLNLAKRDQFDLVSPMLEKPLPERRAILHRKGLLRWRQKFKFARQRVQRSGWAEACHQFFLEVLGYRRNRAPMFSIAVSFTLEQMTASDQPGIYYYQQQLQKWKLAGIRPFNHPKIRLEQYIGLLKKNAGWPGPLLEELGALPAATSADLDTYTFRKQTRLPGIKKLIQEKLLGGCLGGSRIDTMVCDAFLPLVAAETDRDLFPYWFHWYGGDMPDSLARFLKDSEVTDGRHFSACNGYNQGALQIFIEEDLR